MKAGFVAVAGRPNVGKSTLFNRLLGPELSIVSHRRQTTRYCIRGMVNLAECQLVLVDTPGWQTEHGGALNRALRIRAEKAMPAADSCLLVVEGSILRPDDRTVLKLAPKLPLVVAINKLDLVKRREELLPVMAELANWREDIVIVPVSAKTGEGIDYLIEELSKQMPESPRLFDADTVTDMDEKFIATEFIREQLFRRLGEEVPYKTAVYIRKFEKNEKLLLVEADIVVDRKSCQAMIVGKQGSSIKLIGTSARRKLIKFSGLKVRLDLQVVVSKNWHSKPGQLAKFGLLGDN